MQSDGHEQLGEEFNATKNAPGETRMMVPLRNWQNRKRSLGCATVRRFNLCKIEAPSFRSWKLCPGEGVSGATGKSQACFSRLAQDALKKVDEEALPWCGIELRRCRTQAGGGSPRYILSSKGWRHGFCRRHRIRYRKINHKSTNDPETTRRIGSIWVKRPQKKRKYPEDYQCEKQVRWAEQNYFSIDEAPIVFEADGFTYADSSQGGLDAQQVAVKEGSKGYQFCTVIVRISPQGYHKFGLIFRGSWDERSFKEERKKYDKDCFVFFQPNA